MVLGQFARNVHIVCVCVYLQNLFVYGMKCSTL